MINSVGIRFNIKDVPIITFLRHLIDHKSVEGQSERQDQIDEYQNDAQQRLTDLTKHHHVYPKPLKPAHREEKTVSDILLRQCIITPDVPLQVEEQVDPGGERRQSSGLPVPGCLHVQHERKDEEQGADGRSPVHHVRDVLQVLEPLVRGNRVIRLFRFLQHLPVLIVHHKIWCGGIPNRTC